MKKSTKIIATISDRRCDTEFLRQLIAAGMNVVRINSAHLDEEGMRRIVANVREASDSVAIMVDTKGPEVRTTATEADQPVIFKTGDVVALAGDSAMATTHDCIYVNYPEIAYDMRPGCRVLIDDGELDFEVMRIEGARIILRAANDGTLGSRKTVNVPGVRLNLPALSERDLKYIAIADKLDVDFIAHSFVRSASDVKAVQAMLDHLGSSMKILAKIENQEGVDNFDEILHESYGIMIARGDLGVEIPLERVPGIQTMMIQKCIAAHRPVIVATQMLHSMIEHPRPTRAEVSDVAAAVYQRADAMMLSGETANGRYPVEAVATMTRVIREVEESQDRSVEIPPLMDRKVTSFLSRQAVLSEKAVGTKAILTDSYRGVTARYIASFRGGIPTIAICYNRHVQRWLALSYGVSAYYRTEARNTGFKHPVSAFKRLVADGLLTPPDRVAYLSGTDNGATSLEIDTLGNLYY